jgi:hypothetical protein
VKIKMGLHEEIDTEIQRVTTTHIKGEDGGRSHMMGVQDATGRSRNSEGGGSMLLQNIGIHL